MISFCLNGVWKQEYDVDPSTLLRYLRSVQGLTGTKEGCASGDCGACTVLIGNRNDETSNDWQFESANSCITLVSQLNGKALLTVEALANRGQLHPAQQAMVDCHGSQCGFCTPGFVMSLAGLYRQANAADSIEVNRQDIVEALAGNLCRCTGYRPIIEAGQKMLSMPEPQSGVQQQEFQQPGSQQLGSQQKSSQHPDPQEVAIWCPPPVPDAAAKHNAGGSLAQGNRSANAPVTEKELQLLLADDPNARLVAGATDIALEVTQQFRDIDNTIYLGDIDTLQAITENDQDFVIGSAVSYSRLESLFDQYFPEFGGMLRRLGSRQIRNQGTLGGNIGNASPIGDTPPVLIALGADIQLMNHHGQERWMPLEKFFLSYKKTALQPGEYIRSIRVPKLGEEEALKVYKISKRLEDDISAVLLAVWCKQSQQSIADIRVAFGGMAAVPMRAASVEAALQGKTISPQVFEQAGQQLQKDFQPLTDVRASSGYRLQVAANLLQKCAWELMSPDQVTRIEDIHGDFSGEGQKHA